MKVHLHTITAKLLECTFFMMDICSDLFYALCACAYSMSLHKIHNALPLHILAFRL